MNTEKLPLNKRVSPLDSISFKVEKSRREALLQPAVAARAAP